MKYRVHGQDGITREPRPPLDIEAVTEEAARQQAARAGMEVLRVELAFPRSTKPEEAPLRGGPNEKVRATLRVVGPVVILAGILLILGGCGQQSAEEKRRNAQSKEFMQGKRDIHDIDRGPGAGFFLIGAGMFAIFAGLGITSFAFQRALLRYQAGEYVPVVKEALQEVAPGLGRALGSTPGTVSLRCTSCNADNPADANFCKNCGSRLPHPLVCQACGQGNDSDAKFCNKCGGPLG
jgi:ribosomal protein L40E